MELVEIGAQLLSEKLGLDVDASTVSNALSSLLGDGQGNIDFAGLAAKMTASGGLGSVLNSWLGDGANSPIDASSITDLLGGGALSEFAGAIGTDADSAAGGLADVLPQLMDKASSGGELLESVGGVGGLLGAAKSFLS
ncbi:MAG: YidB family protein [Pseudomonadota bacterium]